MAYSTLGQRIASQRKKLGISQEVLAEKMEVSRQAVSKWESDGAIPEIDKLLSLCKFFSVPIGWLLGTEDELPNVQVNRTLADIDSITITIRYIV